MLPPALLEALAPASWPTFVLLSARIGGLMLTAPLWSMTGMPKATKAGLVVLLTITLLPATPRVAAPADPIGLPLPMVTELLIGLTLGLTAGVFMHGVSLAAEFVSVQMGLSIGQVFLPAAELNVPGVGQLFGFLAMAVYLSMGGHLMLLEGLAESLTVLPPGAMIDIVVGGREAVGMIGTLFTSAARVAAPVMVALLIANVAVAILSKAVPQLNAMAVSFPITIGLGFIMLGASLPVLATTVGGWVGGLEGSIDHLLRSFAPAPVGP